MSKHLYQVEESWGFGKPDLIAYKVNKETALAYYASEVREKGMQGYSQRVLKSKMGLFATTQLGAWKAFAKQQKVEVNHAAAELKVHQKQLDYATKQIGRLSS